MTAMALPTGSVSETGRSGGGGISDRGVGLLRAMMERVDQHDASAFNNLGVLYHTRGMHVEAVEAFMRALRLEPRMHAATKNLATVATVPGACDRHIALLDAKLADNPNDRHALRQRARLMRLIGRTGEASAQLESILSADPDDAEALYERGLIEQHLGDLRRAQLWLERSVNAGRSPEAQLNLAEVLYQRGQNEQALQLLDALLDEFPRLADAHMLRGFVLGDMGYPEQASEATRVATSLNPALGTAGGALTITSDIAVGAPVMSIEPEGTLARYSLGMAFRQRGYFAEARAELEKAAESGEDATLVQHALAELDLIAGDHESARLRYEALLKEKETARWWTEHGVARHQAGAVGDAINSYRHALHLDPKDALAYNNLGVALADGADFAAAKDAFKRSAELDTLLARSRRNLALLIAKEGNPQAALTILRELTAFHPKDAESWYLTGVVQHGLGNLMESRESWARAVDLRPGYADARFSLAEVLAQLGDHEGAVQETQRALKLASVKTEPRLTVELELHRECPDAVGNLNLLVLSSATPLAGVSLAAGEVEEMLKERGHDAVPALGIDRVKSLLQEADRFAADSLYGEALERYEQARSLTEHDESASGLWVRAAMGELRSRCLLRRSAGSESLVRLLAAKLGSDPELLILKAAALMDRAEASANEHDARECTGLALAALRSLLAMSVESAALLHFAGDTAVRANDSRLALSLYRCALALDPVRPTPRVTIAQVLRNQGDLHAAHLEIVAALAVAPEWHEARAELARIHRAAGRLEEAGRSLVQCLQRVPTDIGVMLDLADVLILQERHGDASEVVHRVLRRDATNVRALWYDSILLVRNGRIREACARWSGILSDHDAGDVRNWAEAALRRAAGIKPALPDGHACPTASLKVA